jgi:hypothetical protein
MRAALLILTTALLAACSHQGVQECPAPPLPQRVPYEVKVPVYMDRVPPAELVRPYKPLNIPKFLQPTDEKAVVGLDEEGLDRLKIILRTIKTRDDAWRAWAVKPSGKTK